MFIFHRPRWPLLIGTVLILIGCVVYMALPGCSVGYKMTPTDHVGDTNEMVKPNAAYWRSHPNAPTASGNDLRGDHLVCGRLVP